MFCEMCFTRGGYELKCVSCCAHLVLKTRPDKTRAQAMLHHIGKTPNTPKRGDILKRVQEAIHAGI